MRVVASTGLHSAKYYESVPWANEESPERMAERFVDDVELGIDRNDYLGEVIERSDFRAGVIKVGALTPELTDRDMRVFEAAAIAHDRTGVPILTHTEGGLGGVGQVEALMRLGVSPDRVAVSHTDKVADTAYHREIMSSGALLCYDQALRWEDDNQTARLVVEMISDGFVSKVLLGTDGARRSLWSTLGGQPGLAYLFQGFVDELKALGLGDSHVEALFVANPTRYLAFDAASSE